MLLVASRALLGLTLLTVGAAAQVCDWWAGPPAITSLGCGSSPPGPSSAAYQVDIGFKPYWGCGGLFGGGSGPALRFLNTDTSASVSFKVGGCSDFGHSGSSNVIALAHATFPPGTLVHVDAGWWDNNIGIFVPCASGGGATELIMAGPTAPTITQQPTKQSGYAGDTITFSVTAGSYTGSVSYQWRKDGTTLLGATQSKYTIPGISAASVGVYDVVIANGCASVTSDPADLVLLTGTPYGASVAGSGGFTPSLLIDDSVAPGQAFSLDVIQALGGAPGVLVVGFSQASLPYKCGELLVGGPPLLLLGLTLDGPSGEAGAGKATLPLQVPADPAWTGVQVFFQFVNVDPGACKSVAMSSGLVVSIQ